MWGVQGSEGAADRLLDDIIPPGWWRAALPHRPDNMFSSFSDDVVLGYGRFRDTVTGSVTARQHRSAPRTTGGVTHGGTEGRSGPRSFS